MTQISKIKYSSKLLVMMLRSTLVFTLSSMLIVSPVLAVEVTQESKEVVEAPKKESSGLELRLPKKKAPSVGFNNTQIQPPNLNPRSSAEYYSTIPDAKLLIPIHVWGEIKEPGLHFVPMGSSISEAISSCGGPLTSASLPEVELHRVNEKVRDVDIFKTGLSEKLSANDTIVIDRSVKADLPLYFSALSVLVSVATLIVLMNRTR